MKQIFQLRDNGLQQKEIAAKIGISPTSISLMLSGKNWNYLGESREYNKKPRLTKSLKQEIMKLNSQG